MKCIICHGENIQLKEIKEEIPVGNDIVYLPLKVHVCQNCGERYYSRKAMQSLEHLRKNVAKRKSQLKEIGKVLIYDVVKKV